MKQFELNVDQDNKITCVDDQINEVSIPLDSIVSLRLYHAGKQKYIKKSYYFLNWLEWTLLFFVVKVAIEATVVSIAIGSVPASTFNDVSAFFAACVFWGAIFAAIPTQRPKNNISLISRTKIKHMETNEAGLIIKYSIALGGKKSIEVIKVPIIITDYVLDDSDEYKARMQQVDEVRTKLASLNPAIVLDQKKG